jgi:hydroxymethylglutaryl-CoA lyase
VDPAAHTGPPLGLFAKVPRRVDVYEVGPRDGLQNEARTLKPEEKVQLISALEAAGEKRIEVTSFVSPKWIPQLADAEEVMKRLPPAKGVQRSALVPNKKGLERALSAGLTEACVFMSVTEGHSKKNINKTVAEAIEMVHETADAALKSGIRVRAYLSCVWGCPFEGKVSVAQVVEVVKALAPLNIYQLSLGDTIGVGTPGQTAELIEAIRQHVPIEKLALHLHDTRGTALANAMVGLQMGITTFDASIGGLGGCPYAPGAAGNLATEDLVYMLHGLGIETGLSLEKLVAAGELAQKLVGRKLSGKFLQASVGEREKASKR